ncbi:DHH family phosphoesterase [Hoyosella rhizosphaerae]|uniref:Phosphoesterase n=1 Tax=Hoyosella rhizosphaerae TaxID=1755582 RepID=A0A916U6G5_9ACTN|nr:DHH family phosphoesterase [Hoyosella rhizosphaerae]MBN4926296.1 DHH family phosphoesterase [Hoyosella rhizosphaerae]GGC60458.1 phosphoesterase [Hoyosella rhizosphaerae]
MASQEAATPQSQHVRTGVEAVAETLRGARSALVACHVFPDADTLGSGLAVAIMLKRWGVPVWVSFAEPSEIPSAFVTLPGARDVVRPDDVPDDVDVVVAVDSASSERLGVLASRIAGARETVVIDHHRSNRGYGTINYVDPSADSTTMLIARVMHALNEPITEDIAHCLFAGLVTDTGSFRWCGPAAHLLAAELLATGIDAPAITRELLDTHPFGRLSMLASVLGTAQLLPNAAQGRGLVYTIVRLADISGIPEDERETVVDIVRGTGEAEVAAVIKELSPDRWSVSLRSKSSVDVAEVASALGGGGHTRSAGFETDGEVEDLIASLVRELA